jgi:plasmid stability protein
MRIHNGTVRNHRETIMPVNFSVKGVPDDLAARLRERAAANHRSLQGELMAILHEATSPQPAAAADWRQRFRPAATARGGRPSTIDEVVARIKARSPTPRARGPSSVDVIRQMRDDRYGDAWLAAREDTAAAKKPARRGR